MKPITLGELVEFVLVNRKGNAFKDYSEEVIAASLKRGADNGLMFYTATDGLVDGVILLHHDTANNVIWVHDILTTTHKAFKLIVGLYKTKFNGMKIAGLRHGKPMHYNSERLYRLVTKGEQ